MGRGHNRRRIAIWLSVTILLASLIALAISQIAPISNPAQLTLPDGTTVRVEAMTFGTEHSFSADPVRDKLRRWAPKVCQRFLGKSPFGAKMQTGPDSMVIWVTRLGPAAGPSLQRELHYLSDHHGCRFQSFYRSTTRIPGGTLMGVACDNFPRGEQTFDYVIADRDNGTLARFRLTNPFKVVPKLLRPEQLPITKTDGELVVELRRLARVYSENPQMPFNSAIKIIRAVDERF